MAFCKKCGAQLEDGAKFCPKCGATHEEVVVAPAAQAVAETGPWKVFAILGLVGGITGLVFGLLWGSGIFLAAAGLVFSILGKRSVSKKGMASAGMILSIIALALSVIMFIACFACAACAASAVDGVYY